MKIFINLYCFCSLFIFSSLTFAFSGGTGTKNDPYLIMDCQGLQSIVNFPGASFKLINDIDCAGFDSGDKQGFLPIGTSAYPFIGILDGDHFTISNLIIYRSTQNNVGLIGYMGSGGIVKNIKMTDANISGNSNTGGVIGYATSSNAIITDIYFSGAVSGNSSVGGVVGYSSSPITNSYVDASVTGINQVGGLAGNIYRANITNNSAVGEVKSTSPTGSDVGGLVGQYYGNNNIIDKCFSDSTVTGYNSVGGLIGYAFYSQLKNSFANASVYGNYDVGGLVGRTYGGASIMDAYAQGIAAGDHYIGGLIGNNDSTVTNSYAATKVTAAIYGGGLVGYSYNNRTVTNSYWDTNVSGQPFSVGGTPKTTAEMYQQATYVNWNFNSIWQIDQNVNYPQLK